MPKQTGVNYGADLLLRSVGDNPSQRQGTLTGFNYDTVPRTRERPLVGAQDVRSYLEWLGQGGGLQNLNALGQGLFGPQGRQTVSDIAHNVQGPVQPLGLGMGGPNEMMGHAMDFLNPMAKVGGILGQTVFHGSPHKFDKFDISKIGTGEGAQAYGHGLYFAENPQVAMEYQKNITSQPSSIAQSWLSAHGRPSAALDAIERSIKKRNREAMQQGFKPDVAKLNAIKKELKKAVESEEGSLYKVDIPDADIQRMLDWDKPDWQQPKALQDLGRELGLQEWMGTDLMLALKQRYRQAGAANPEQMVSKELQSLGIPGIKYYDQGSRGLGEGTRNYVTFGDEGLKILERNWGGESLSVADDPLKNIVDKWEGAGLKIDAYSGKRSPDLLTLSRIEVPKAQRGQGLGSEAMTDLLNYANANQKTIALTPDTAFGGTSVARLKRFYKQQGFVENKGRNKDFTISESMYKRPE